MSKITDMLVMSALVSSSMNECCPRKENVRKDTSNIGGGYEHSGMYSQSKKLRKGAGHKKLTRAKRKKTREKQWKNIANVKSKKLKTSLNFIKR